jgi:hypothetical protein
LDHATDEYQESLSKKTFNFMTNFFQFEADFVDSLRCIPMQVRMKLDTCGIKLKLTHWHQFTQQERQALVEMPCTTAEKSKPIGNMCNS